MARFLTVQPFPALCPSAYSSRRRLTSEPERARGGAEMWHISKTGTKQQTSRMTGERSKREEGDFPSFFFLPARGDRADTKVLIKSFVEAQGWKGMQKAVSGRSVTTISGRVRLKIFWVHLQPCRTDAVTVTSNNPLGLFWNVSVRTNYVHGSKRQRIEHLITLIIRSFIF